MFGFAVYGDSHQLIMGDEYRVLTQKYRGALNVNQVPPAVHVTHQGFNGNVVPSYGYCTVTYPSRITTQLPPMVFAVPTANANNKGIGLFCHRGSPGNWTGFSVLITNSLFATSSSRIVSGFASGWEYRVCVFGEPGVVRAGANLSAGMNIGCVVRDSKGIKVFDTNWPYVPFRGLMSQWKLHSYTRSYRIIEHWGYRFVDGAADQVLAKGTHTWGYANGTVGFLLSALSAIPVRHDIGTRNITTPSIVTMGFDSSSRSQIWSVVYQGLSQHPSGDVTAMNNWRMLTADFTWV